MAFVAAPFAYWRGSITFRFEIVCSSFHRGKLAIFYEPNIAQALLVTNRININKHYVQIIDLQETQNLSVTVNWAQPRDWARVAPSEGVDASYGIGFSTTSSSYEFVNGFIGVTPFTELQSPDDSRVDINVYVSGCDMEFAVLSRDNIPNSRRLPGEPVPVVLETQFLSDTAPVQVNLNPELYNSETVCTTHFGERYVSFRPLLKRYVSTYTFNIGPGSPNQLLRIRSLTNPSHSPAYFPEPTSDVPAPSLMTYLPYAFMGARGGIRKRLHVRSYTPSDNVLNRVTITNYPTRSQTTYEVFWDARYSIMFQEGSVAFQPSTNSGIEFEVPYYSANYFHFSFSGDLVGPNTLNDMIFPFNRSYDARIEIESGTLDIDVVEDTAAAEDFTFFRFQGAPFYSYVA
jgi:hypothetical protein